MADFYGAGSINDTSLLSGENAATARTIQNAFTRSKLARDRQGLRYGLPALSSFNNDNALAQAQTTAGILNNNQQLQNMIDASNATPHGFMENLSAYGPALSSLLRLSPALFGTNTMGALGREGLIPAAYRQVTSWFKDPNTGQTWGLDGSGKVVTAFDVEGNVIPGYGMYDRGLGSMGDYTAQTGMANYGQFDRGIGWDWSGMPTQGAWPAWDMGGGGGDWGGLGATDWTTGFGGDSVDWGGAVDWFGGW